MKILSRYTPYIGYKIEGATTDNEVITDIFIEGDKVYCVIDESYEAEFDCVIIDLVMGGGTYVRTR